MRFTAIKTIIQEGLYVQYMQCLYVQYIHISHHIINYITNVRSREGSVGHNKTIFTKLRTLLVIIRK